MQNNTVCFPIHSLQLCDRAVFETMFYKFSGEIYSFCSKQVPREDAEDITHEIFIALWKQSPKISGEDHLKNYLYKIARNKIVDLKKKNYTHHKKLLTEAIYFFSVPEKMVEEEINDMLHRVELLPTKCRTIVKLFLEKKSPEEISTILGIDKKTVYNHYANGAKKIRASLKLR